MTAGRAPTGQALAIPVEPASGLAPPGFDPSRDGAWVFIEPTTAQRLMDWNVLHLAEDGRFVIDFDIWASRKEPKGMTCYGLDRMLLIWLAGVFLGAAIVGLCAAFTWVRK